MANTEKSETSFKWIEYTLYAGALAFVLVAVYQLVSTHRIVLLERAIYTQTDSGASTAPETAVADTVDEGEGA